MPSRTFLTTSIPYVNAPAHVGHALEFVEADVLARAKRRRGEVVRFQSGTDDHALKNVRAAEDAGRPVDAHVRANAEVFAQLWDALGLTLDDTIRTSADERHRPGVEALWAACDGAGDLYQKAYEGLYCVGCEEFYLADDLEGGRCPDHQTPPEPVAETNWFFRLTRYEDTLRDAIARGRLRVEPQGARNEVLALIDRGLEDFSVSRAAARARGWGITVPGDPEQVVAVWFDALTNYISALDYGSSDTASFQTWWCGSDRRTHVIGKGILRQHAVYWPAILLSAGLPLPTDILVHPYLTVDGRKIGKSTGNAVDPLAIVHEYGTDALRWWLASVVPLSADADFTVAGLVDVANRDLANGFGNLVSRLVALRRRCARQADPDPSAACLGGAQALDRAVPDALDRFELRRATQALTAAVAETNRYLEQEEPWRSDDDGHVAAVTATATAAARITAGWFEPFVPDLATRAVARLDESSPPASGGPLFPRLTLRQ